MYEYSHKYLLYSYRFLYPTIYTNDWCFHLQSTSLFYLTFLHEELTSNSKINVSKYEILVSIPN